MYAPPSQSDPPRSKFRRACTHFEWYALNLPRKRTQPRESTDEGSRPRSRGFTAGIHSRRIRGLTHAVRPRTRPHNLEDVLRLQSEHQRLSIQIYTTAKPLFNRRVQSTRSIQSRLKPGVIRVDCSRPNAKPNPKLNPNPETPTQAPTPTPQSKELDMI